jgi:hypothetical protein
VIQPILRDPFGHDEQRANGVGADSPGVEEEQGDAQQVPGTLAAVPKDHEWDEDEQERERIERADVDVPAAVREKIFA